MSYRLQFDSNIATQTILKPSVIHHDVPKTQPFVLPSIPLSSSSMVKSLSWTQAEASRQCPGILIDPYWPNAPPVCPATTPRTDPPGTPFPLLSLPRELRDLVYFHALPHTLKYQQPTSKALSRWQLHAEMDWPRRPRESHPHLFLFLVSRQVHLEAQEMLFRATTITLPPGTRLPWRIKRFQRDERLPLRSVLASISAPAAALLTKIHREYCGDTDVFFRDGEIDDAFGMWAHVVSEARILGDCFPRLGKFFVEWQTFEKQIASRFWHLVAGVDPGWREAERQTHVEEVAGLFVGWLESCVGNKGLVPPAWLRIEFAWNEQVLERDKYGMKLLQDALKLAHRLFAQRRLTGDERDDSGRVWLEGLSEKRKRGRKGWCDAVALT